MGKDVVEIEVHLTNHPVAAHTVDRDDRFGSKLELISNIDDTWIDCSGGPLFVVEIADLAFQTI